MTPEFANLIQSYPEASEESIKLIFLRDSAKRAYIEDRIKENTGTVLSEIISLGTAGSMSKESIGIHIGNLEKCRAFISCIIQGYKTAFSEEMAPEFKRRAEEREKEKKTGITRKSLEDKLAAFGLTLGDFDKKALEVAPATPKELTKVVCPKCSKETISLGLHRC